VILTTFYGDQPVIHLIISSSLNLTAGLLDVQLVNQSFKQEVIQFFLTVIGRSGFSLWICHSVSNLVSYLFNQPVS